MGGWGVGMMDVFGFWSKIFETFLKANLIMNIPAL